MSTLTEWTSEESPHHPLVGRRVVYPATDRIDAIDVRGAFSKQVVRIMSVPGVGEVFDVGSYGSFVGFTDV
jgi:hypothetical protein